MALRTPTKGSPLGTHNRNMRESQRLSLSEIRSGQGYRGLTCIRPEQGQSMGLFVFGRFRASGIDFLGIWFRVLDLDFRVYGLGFWI